MGRDTWDPNYTPRMDFLDHDYFVSLKKFTVFLQCLFYSFGQNSKVIIADIIMIMTMTKKQDTKNEKKGNIFFKFL